MPLLNLQIRILRTLDTLARRLDRHRSRRPAHLATGIRGEREALLHLRTLGYVVVARRWNTAKLRGDIDLVAWDGALLCFIEVKTRTVRDLSPAESSVDSNKQRTLGSLARVYLRSFPEPLRSSIPVRFDIVSVYLQPSATEVEVYQGAFGWA